MTLARASARTLCAVSVMILFVTLPTAGAAPADAAKTAAAPAATPAPPPAPPSWDRPVNDLLRSPAVLLMTPDEYVAYAGASSIGQRAQIRERFWRSATPNCPLGPDNAVRTAFQSAVIEANDKFGDEGVPGWTTDRGSIYVLAGPPATTETKAAGGQQLLVWTWNAGANPAQVVFVRDRLTWRYAGETVETASVSADRALLLARLAGAYRSRGCQLTAEQKAEVQQVAWRKDLFDATEPLLKGGKAEIENPNEPVWYFFPAENDATFVMLTVVLDKPLADGEKLVGIVRSVDAPDSVFSFGTEDIPFQVRSVPGGALAQSVRTLQPGHYVQALARVSADGVTTKMFAGERVIPTLRRDALTLTSVILASGLKALGTDEGKAPFRLYGFDIVPNPDAIYHPGDAMTLFFVAMGAEDPATKKTDLRVSYHIYFSDPRKGWVDTKAQAVSPKQEASVQARDLTLPATWPIGDYKVVIEVTDNRSGAAVKKEIGFGLRKKS